MSLIDEIQSELQHYRTTTHRIKIDNEDNTCYKIGETNYHRSWNKLTRQEKLNRLMKFHYLLNQTYNLNQTASCNLQKLFFMHTDIFDDVIVDYDEGRGIIGTINGLKKSSCDEFYIDYLDNKPKGIKIDIKLFDFKSLKTKK